jgi:hypothetical protein
MRRVSKLFTRQEHQIHKYATTECCSLARNVADLNFTFHVLIYNQPALESRAGKSSLILNILTQIVSHNFVFPFQLLGARAQGASTMFMIHHEIKMQLFGGEVESQAILN